MTPLPTTGTLTFLFTDIQGSTRRWAEHPEGMSGALLRHDELLREAVERHGGGVFKHTGDGVSAVFASPYDAVAAAVAAQRSLVNEPWGPVGDLPVRMGIHIGRAEYRMSDYFGPTLNRVARLMSVAHGGQIVVSGPTREIVGDDLPSDVSLVDLGEHRLADLARPEHVFQVVHPNLPAAFPPLRALAVDRHNLPTALTHFVGRQAELEKVAQLLGKDRLVTIAGVGGSGKTRLAIRAAEDALDAFRDGVFLVELGPLTDPDLVPGAVSIALGAGENPPDKLCETLRSRRLLLVLDNCEHLIGAAADLCEVLLGRCPDLTILATSREPLDVPGEVVWRLPSLSLPPAEPVAGDGMSGDAVALFCDRARAVDPEFQLSAENAPAVARICRVLDGIPLALELAAARLRMLPPDQLAERLHDRFSLLTGGGRKGLARHQTLRAAMDWSYDLLTEGERTLLGRLSVFAGSFSVEAAEGVGADGETLGTSEVFDLLSHLVDKSLVGAETGEREARYRLLATVRQYAREKLAETGESDAVAGRHRDFFLCRLEGSEVSLDEWTSLRWLGPDQENVRLALWWSLEHGDVDASLRLGAVLLGYWSFIGKPIDGAAVLERCLALTGGTPSPAAVQVMSNLGFLYLQQGETARAEAHVERAIAVAGSIGDLEGEAFAGGVLGMAALQRGDLDRAEQLMETAARQLKTKRPVTSGWHRFNLSWVALARGDAGRAVKELEVVLAEGEAMRNESLVVHTLAALAPMLALTGDTARAEALAAQGIEAARRLEIRRVLVMALIRAAQVATLVGTPERAGRCLAEALANLRGMAGNAWVVDAVEMAALTLGALGRHRPAARLLGACDARREVSGEVAEGGAIHPLRLRYQEEADSVLGPAQFEEEWRRGAALSRDEMVREALAEIGREAA